MALGNCTMISVIIPIYNAAPYLPELLKALYAQTEQDLEIILVNDGSTDESTDMCLAAAQEDPRICYVYQENAGVSAARNRALAKASGDYIAFLDADDSIDSTYFERLLGTCVSADIAVCDVSVETRSGRRLSIFSAGDQRLTALHAMNLLLTRREINSGPCGKMFRREVITGLQFPALKAYEDILFVRDAFARAQSIASTSAVAYHYYQNAGSAMDQQKKAPSFDIVTATGDLLRYIREHTALDPMCFYITVSHLYQYVLGLGKNTLEERKFKHKVRCLYREYWMDIVRCKAFPWKEKILYLLFAFGLR